MAENNATRTYSLKIFGDQINVADDNVDVEVTLTDGRRFVATFFTIKNIESIMNRYRETGECLHGKYFWSSQMIIIDEIRPSLIFDTIDDLLNSREFESSFREILNNNGSGGC